jgi:hypothetical protein
MEPRETSFFRDPEFDELDTGKIRAMVRPKTSFFRGSELPRLLVLVAVLVVGVGWFWQYARRGPIPVQPPVVADEHPKPIETDRSVEFETVTDRTPMTLRDNAAYALLLDRARARTPGELAQESRRDILMTHLWERPERYRGVPIHLDGTALRVLRYESKLSKTGWLYEAWINTPDSGRFPYTCVFESPPKGFPIGANLSERVVFNGYFLKIMKYEAADVARGAPVIVGRIGWDPSLSSKDEAPGSGSTLKWTLILLAVMICISFARWIATLTRLARQPGSSSRQGASTTDHIDPDALQLWVESAGAEGFKRPSDSAPGPGREPAEDAREVPAP